MDIQALGPSALFLSLDASELAARRLTPEAVTAPVAADLTRDALRRLGRTAPDGMLLDLFPGRESLLIFARFENRYRRYFVFPELEDLIAAARSSPPGIPSRLFYIEGAYVLAVAARERDALFPALEEYGKSLDVGAGYLCHLREHGRELASGNALDALRQAF